MRAGLIQSASSETYLALFYRTNAPYFNALLPKLFVPAPIDGNHNYCYSRLCHYGKAEAAQLVANDLGRATPMYALLLPSKDVDQDIKRLPLIQGYNSKQSEKSNTRPGIMTLTNDVVAFTLDSVFSLRAK